ncbi:SDR family NAD(P)-dependent oxidoreductase [Pedobacter sp. Leaf194]|uniref:SDR family NAD(P)-dependent oxidoreductase n=1 Tax=Pedobacter sp. Leaf194 TaxID=1736297 RepID=UPI0007034D97|nr:SDR family oxidoreductase [Pedobacter sp. Leaf194]KQS36302.1 oxidoreductase [Pedobacter sp. Leaf194]
MRFEDKNILVIGASSGIGLALTGLLEHEGAKVFAASRSRSDSWPESVKFQTLDVTEGFDTLGQFLPEKLHGLIYSVGNINLKPFSRLTEKDFVEDFRLNVLGAAMSIQASLNALKNASQASVVLISSVAARTGMGFHASTATSKAAVEGLALSLAAELASLGIRVNVVAPSLTDTPMASKFLNTPEKIQASDKRHPIGRYGKAKDVSAMIAFLLSEDSSWITGQVISVDGGMSTLRTNL